MRLVAERQAWAKLIKERTGQDPVQVAIDASGVTLTLPGPCTVFAGLNGAGKTRTLRSLNDSLGDKAILIRLHELCEHARVNLRARDDIAEMADETGPLTLDSTTLEHLNRIVGRDYDYVEWYSLDFEPTQDYLSSFSWPEDQVLVPHFRVKHKGIEYSSLDMGLGEYSVHLLFWIFAQYRDAADVYFLLDEPDAFLPPITAERLLVRLLEVARANHWNLLIATHSEAIVEAACQNDAFVLLRRGEDGVEAYSSREHGVSVASDLLPARPVSSLLFCEDESAAALVRAILDTEGGWLTASTSVIWKDGDGYLRKLAQHLPRYRGMRLSMALVFDGDQRAGFDGRGPESEIKWPSLFLPTDKAPDALFRELVLDAPVLAAALNQPLPLVNRALDALEGSDDHDWVNGMCARLGVRTHVLDTMARVWVDNNKGEAAAFLSSLP
ncbi:hypothetical protein [Arthrobacter sp. Cr_A7]|uniref:hypothetical protein n=1 Tax=Arthrobacter sp. Cr_A7 TaxID=3031017 RepID=UPI0023DA305C|nr:hypothetical protein [Arthrobacter sp. Cr_A7]MDF2050238.1 hypothetical protein [Arthrobacter sp. Cr_A7]